jgi:hypothetical protein
MGLAIFGIGVLGVFLGEQPLLGVVNVDRTEDVMHLVTGGAMAAVAFTPRTNHFLRYIVGGSA